MMSERTFARRFAAETGATPHKWLTQQRILAARSLLEESDLSVEQIASRVGFNSAVVLREHFRRTIGVRPVTTGGGSAPSRQTSRCRRDGQQGVPQAVADQRCDDHDVEQAEE